MQQRGLWLSKLGDELGQTVVMFSFSMVAMLGFAALVFDFGSVYQERRQLQNAADGAALAAARELPGSPSSAVNAAQDFLTANGYNPADTDVSIKRQHPLPRQPRGGRGRSHPAPQGLPVRPRPRQDHHGRVRPRRRRDRLLLRGRVRHLRDRRQLRRARHRHPGWTRHLQRHRPHQLQHLHRRERSHLRPDGDLHTARSPKVDRATATAASRNGPAPARSPSAVAGITYDSFAPCDFSFPNPTNLKSRNDVWQDAAKTILIDGVYCFNKSATLIGDDITGHVTFVARGEIVISGSDHDLTAYHPQRDPALQRVERSRRRARRDRQRRTVDRHHVRPQRRREGRRPGQPELLRQHHRPERPPSPATACRSPRAASSTTATPWCASPNS